ncbi:hypothetical protein [Streptomyces broussonetiae]|uniref:Uncharacterized protein n=1 Tax=Streptomyces broussonetiae TaxID=2686304 RepID=A0A6I6NCD3_9ACTN|nr:hypothetical protein [Streptomyces broussonetiae]QHA05946.1 hypothetical protein GQF42_24020 [Streptomyces broussonetiae]
MTSRASTQSTPAATLHTLPRGAGNAAVTEALRRGQAAPVQRMPADTAARTSSLDELEARLREAARDGNTSVLKRHTTILRLDQEVADLESTDGLSDGDRGRVTGLRQGVDQQKAAIEERARRLERYLASDGGPYTMMVDNGQLWTDQYWPYAFARMRERFNPGWFGEKYGRAYFDKLSRKNVEGMRGDTSKVSGDWAKRMRDGLQAQLRSSVLSHYTTERRARLMLSGGMKTKADLEASEFEYKHNTSAFDEHGLANLGFLFFFIEDPSEPFRGTRFSKDEEDPSPPARIRLNIEQSGLLSKGWVMLSDFAQREFPTVMADENDPAETESFLPTRDTEEERKHPEYRRLVRRFEQGMGNLTDADLDEFMALQEQDPKLSQSLSVVRPHVRGDDGSRMVYGPEGQSESYPEPLVRNILTGKDIIPGLAERAVLEVSRIERTTPALADKLKGMSPQQLMKYLLKDLLRPQAMLPRQLKITERDIEVP